jgi:hypothetical protein
MGGHSLAVPERGPRRRRIFAKFCCRRTLTPSLKSRIVRAPIKWLFSQPTFILGPVSLGIAAVVFLTVKLALVESPIADILDFAIAALSFCVVALVPAKENDPEVSSRLGGNQRIDQSGPGFFRIRKVSVKVRRQAKGLEVLRLHTFGMRMAVTRAGRILSKAALCTVVAAASISHMSAAYAVPGFAALCLKFYTLAACDQSLVRWLPETPWSEGSAAPTLEQDAIVDPAGTGELRFLEMRGVFGGSLFVRESGGGPPKGHVVYDPDHRIAYYDEGCCSFHRVVLAITAEPPPRKIATRSLAGLRTTSGIRLGDGPAHVRSI